MPPERQVVLEERRMRVDDSANGRGFEALRARLGLRKPNTRPVFVP